MSKRYPNLKAAIDDGRVKPTDSPPREPRCGPWDEQPDGSFLCRQFLRDIWPTLIPAAGWFAWVGSWFIL